MRPEFHVWLQSAGLELSHGQVASLDAFEEALYAHNEHKNLTRIPREDAWRRHFVDSLLIHDLIAQGASVLDIGAGPGFPAWPLALVRPDLSVTALDSNGKMLEFLRSQPLPNLEIVQARAEDWGVREKFDVVTGRALAPLPIQLELSAAPCRLGGLVIPMRTAKEEDAVVAFPAAKLGLRLRETVQRELPGEDATRLFPVYEKISPTPRQFPRSWAEIKKAQSSNSSRSGPSQGS